MYKIALFSSFNFHLECVGFICELFTNNIYLENTYEIDVYYNEDPFNNLEHYKEIYSNLKNLNNINQLFNKLNEYNLIIKLSSNDGYFIHNNIISILHRIDLTDNINNYITLSPLVTKESIKEKLNYIFPLYSPNTTINYKNIITYIGYFDNSHYDDDLKEFIINSPNYHFNFIYNQLINPFKNHNNVSVYCGLNTKELIEKTKESKFILIRKLPHQSKELFTGSLGIAISLKKPIILQKYFSEIYDLNAITFEKNYCEIVSLINNFPDSIYQKLLIEQNIIFNKINNYNKLKIKNLLDNI